MAEMNSKGYWTMEPERPYSGTSRRCPCCGAQTTDSRQKQVLPQFRGGIGHSDPEGFTRRVQMSEFFRMYQDWAGIADTSAQNAWGSPGTTACKETESND